MAAHAIKQEGRGKHPHGVIELIDGDALENLNVQKDVFGHPYRVLRQQSEEAWVPIDISPRRAPATSIDELTYLRIDELLATRECINQFVNPSIRKFVNVIARVPQPRSFVSMCDRSKSRQGGSSR